VPMGGFGRIWQSLAQGEAPAAEAAGAEGGLRRVLGLRGPRPDENRAVILARHQRRAESLRQHRVIERDREEVAIGCAGGF